MSSSIYALRAIEQGEQIFISYLPTLRSRKECQSELLTKYFFTCHCSSCSLLKGEPMHSRSLLCRADQQTDLFHNSVMDWAGDRSLLDRHIAKHSERIMDTMEEENLCEGSLAI
jgi:hypothetical protein